MGFRIPPAPFRSLQYLAVDCSSDFPVQALEPDAQIFGFRLKNRVLPFWHIGVIVSRMKTLTMKLPDELLGWLEQEAKRARRPKSALVREILKMHLSSQRRSALDLAADLCGSVESGLRDLSRNRKHLKGFGK